MAIQRSNINVSLRKKRRLSRMKKIAYSTIFILFFITLGILGLTSNTVRVHTVVVTGNKTVSNEQISTIVNTILDKKYVWIIPTDNYLLLGRDDIKDQILKTIQTINVVQVSFHGLNTIEVTVSERVAQDLWCVDNPSASKNCFLMDTTGFVFATSSFAIATSSATSTFPIYFGFIKGENPVGKFYFDSHRFNEIAELMRVLTQMNFGPKYFYAVDEHTYQVYLRDGGKILLNNAKTFQGSLTNLQAVMNDGFIKTDEVSLKKISYIDLQSDNKVFCSPSAVCKQTGR